MRILNIYFKNINSLEGEGRVYFDRGPIADSGVFAITGPNGSGKTSILDVITLALYGETFRFDKPAQHVITKHADESLAQIDFSIGGESYRSSWQVKRGIETLPEMRLLRLNDEQTLAQTPNQVRSLLAELTGMDFHKFSKAIVLPQGDFAAFLNALDSERLDILEKISGTDLYADYRRQAETRLSASQAKVKLLESELGLIPLLAGEAIEAAEHDLQDFNDQRDGFEQAFADLQARLQVLQQIAAQQARQQQLTEQQHLLQEEIQRHHQDLQRLNLLPQAETFKIELQAFDSQFADAQQQRARLQEYQNELTQLQQQLKALGDDGSAVIPAGKSFQEQQQAIDALKLQISDIKRELPRETEASQAIQQQLENNKTALTEVEDWLAAHQNDAPLLSDFPEVAKLRNLRTELATLNGQHKTQSKWLKNTSSALKKNQEALNGTETRLEDLKKQIAADEQALQTLSQGKSQEELNELLTDQQNRVADVQEIYSLAGVNAKFSKKGLFAWFSRDKDLDLPDESQLQARIDALSEEMNSEENIAKALQQAIVNEALLKQMSTFRDKLVDGKPCFLCGSTSHPYVIKPPVASDSKKALADQRAKTQALKSRLDQAKNQLSAAQKRTSQLSAKQKFLQEKRSTWSMLANKLNLMREGLSIDNLSLQKDLVIAETEELTKIQNLLKEYGQLQRNIAKAKAEIDTQQGVLKTLRESGAELNATWTERSPQAQEMEKQFSQCQAEEKALVERLEKQLGSLNEKLPAKRKENALIDRLNSRRQDYQIRQLRQTALREEIAALQEKAQACQTAILNYQRQLNDSLEALRNAEGLGLHLAVLEKQRLIFDLERQLADREMGLERLQHALLQRSGEQGFSDLEDIRHILQLGERQAELRRLENEQNARLSALTTEIQQLGAQLQTDMAGVEANVTEADLLAQQNRLRQQIDIAEQEIRTLTNKLDKQQSYRNKYHTLETDLAEQRRLLGEAEAEMRQINDQQGGFRRRIQQLLIDKLLSQTNAILEKISGRYYLRSAHSEHGLALEVEDTKQKNARRLPKTLSGGESFVVSLALALALAEMANNGKAIESLFLDEGFGNLDPDALYLALSALEGLKIQGKTVGVISHVEGVKKRIKTQIELVKKPNGFSELRMVA